MFFVQPFEESVQILLVFLRLSISEVSYQVFNIIFVSPTPKWHVQLHLHQLTVSSGLPSHLSFISYVLSFKFNAVDVRGCSRIASRPQKAETVVPGFS